MAHLEKLHKTLLPDVQVSPLPDKDPAPSLSANTGEQQQGPASFPTSNNFVHGQSSKSLKGWV